MTHIETQLEMETMKAVPTPRFDVGENTLAAQLLHMTKYQPMNVSQCETSRVTYMTSGNRL